MTQAIASDLLHHVWEFPLFAALYGRRSRRFGLGFAIDEGPHRHRSGSTPVPLDEVEEALLVATATGVSGIPLWDGSRPPARRGGDGRTFGSTTHGRRTALFFTNDRGVFVIDPAAPVATKLQEIDTRDERARILALYDRHRRQLASERLPIPRRMPPLFGHNHWSCNQPGTTLFMPVADLSLVLIALILALVDGDGGRYVRGQGGGMNIIDDRRGGRPAGTEAWITSGLIDPGKPLPLSILERQTCYFIFSEPATMCHNIFLATEAMGIGGWMHCGFLSLELMRALGFRMVEGAAGSYPNPVGCDGVLEGFCPPYHRDMDAAVDAALESLAGGRTAAMQPHAMVEEAYRAAILDVPSAAGIACAKSVCRYIYETYGRFPASVDAMHLMWFMQAHHLDVGYYRRHYVRGALSPRHAEHMAVWHGEQSPC